MSKMLTALNKARQLREMEAQLSVPNVASVDDVSEDSQSHVAIKFINSRMAMMGVLLVMGMCSIYTNFKTLSELTKSKQAMTSVVKTISLQKNELQNLAQGKILEASAVDQLNKQLREIKEQIASKQSQADDQEIAYNILRIKFDDLALTNTALMENFIGISDELEELKYNTHKFWSALETRHIRDEPLSVENKL